MAGISAIIFDVRLKKAKNNSADPFNKKLRETGSAWDMTLWIMFETCWVTGFVRDYHSTFNSINVNA
jgi:hypothetical protein